MTSIEGRFSMHRLQFLAGKVILPKSKREEFLKSYMQRYTCCPPPLVMLLATLIEIGIYIYYVVDDPYKSGVSISGPSPMYSPLIYDPYRRYQVWRFLTYALMHIGIYHILFNCLTQLLLGIPLEMVHNWYRIAAVYIIGSIAGSLAVSVVDSKTFLAGASGGCYALLTAHIANLLINWSDMKWNWVRLVFMVILIGSDFGVAIFNRYFVNDPNAPRISHVAHIGGGIAGVLVGIVVLRNFSHKKWERWVWWVALVISILLILFAIIFNAALMNTGHYYAAVYKPFLWPKPGGIA